MLLPAPCGICVTQNQAANSDKKIPIVFYPGRITDHGYVRLKCTKDHESIIIFDERKHEILFRSACHALIAGYEREAVSSFAASFERCLEFFVRVSFRHHLIPQEAFKKSWKLMSKQSERQLGSFLTIYLLSTKEAYSLNQKMITFRNKVIYQGYIPDKKETDSFGDYVFTQKLALNKILKDKHSVALEAEIKKEVEEMKNNAPKGIPQIGFKSTLASVDRNTNIAHEIITFQNDILGLQENKERMFG